MNTSKVGWASALVLCGVSLASPLAGQGFLMPETPPKGIGLEVSHPSFKEFDVTLPTSIWYASGQLPLMDRLRARVDIPLAFADFKGDDEGIGSSTVLGNPYVGLAFDPVPALTLELGTRLPLTTADEESFADVVAFLADVQRGEAFVEDFVPVMASAAYRLSPAPGWTVEGRGGVSSLFYTGDFDEDNVTFVDYGVFGSYSMGLNSQVAQDMRFGAGILGRWDASEDDGSFSENSLHQAGFTVDLGMRRVRPGLSLRIPLDKDYRDVLKSSVGLYLQVPLR
jgi:hypothetical protein